MAYVLVRVRLRRWYRIHCRVACLVVRNLDQRMNPRLTRRQDSILLHPKNIIPSLSRTSTNSRILLPLCEPPLTFL